jgi:tetratricopeptide (TPR) repeat protein
MQRHRNHVLEDISNTALRSILPDIWVIHTYQNDYGIDVQIEIFEPSGKTTGLRVYGQLKATDNTESDDKLYLDREHFEYWSAHSDPVILLRYYAQTKIFKWCWMHEIEWHLKPDTDSVNASKHLKHFDSAQTPELIENLAKLRREAKLQSSALPIYISVKVKNDIPSSLKIADSIRNKLDDGLLRVLGASTTPCHFDLLLEGERLCITYLGLPGYVVSCEGTDDFETIGEIAIFFLFLIACRYDKSTISKSISRQALPSLCKTASNQFLPLLIDGLIYSNGAPQAISSLLSQDFIEDRHELWLNINLVAPRSCQNYGQLDLWQIQLKEWADSPPYPEIASSAAYNYANSIAHTGQWENAIKYYILAGERDAEYFTREYFWTELAAAQFESGQASSAADSYKMALDLKCDSKIKWRLGDALFHSGQYESALNYINSAAEEDNNLSSYALLVAMLCEELISRWGIKDQLITPISDSIQDKLMRLATTQKVESTIKNIQPFLELSAIDPLTSFNCGHYALISGQPNIAIYRFLTCALRQRGDTEAWSLAIAAAFQAGESQILAMLIETAYFYVGEELLGAVLEVISPPTDTPEELRTEFQEKIVELIRSMESRKENPMTFRINGTDIKEIISNHLN